MSSLITSRTNAHVKRLRAALSQPRAGAVGIEGFHLLREALRSGLRLDAVYVREDREDALSEFAGAAQEAFVLSRDAFDSAAGTEHAQGIAATLQRPVLPFSPRAGDLLLLADGIQDPGNLGTMIRSAEAFGVCTVALTRGTVDPWNGKCLRASAGSVFRVPLPLWDDALRAAISDIGGTLFAAVPTGGRDAHVTDLAGTVVLAIGNEGAGISPSVLASADAHITLHTGGVTESLNAAVAASILLYEASRQRASRLGNSV